MQRRRLAPSVDEVHPAGLIRLLVDVAEPGLDEEHVGQAVAVDVARRLADQPQPAARPVALDPEALVRRQTLEPDVVRVAPPEDDRRRAAPRAEQSKVRAADRDVGEPVAVHVARCRDRGAPEAVLVGVDADRRRAGRLEPDRRPVALAEDDVGRAGAERLAEVLRNRRSHARRRAHDHVVQPVAVDVARGRDGAPEREVAGVGHHHEAVVAEAEEDALRRRCPFAEHDVGATVLPVAGAHNEVVEAVAVHVARAGGGRVVHRAQDEATVSELLELDVAGLAAPEYDVRAAVDRDRRAAVHAAADGRPTRIGDHDVVQPVAVDVPGRRDRRPGAALVLDRRTDDAEGPPGEPRPVDRARPGEQDQRTRRIRLALPDDQILPPVPVDVAGAREHPLLDPLEPHLRAREQIDRADLARGHGRRDGEDDEQESAGQNAPHRLRIMARWDETRAVNARGPPEAGLSLSGRRDLNRGPHRPERCALPGCATPRGGAESSERVRPPRPCSTGRPGRSRASGTRTRA